MGRRSTGVAFLDEDEILEVDAEVGQAGRLGLVDGRSIRPPREVARHDALQHVSQLSQAHLASVSSTHREEEAAAQAHDEGEGEGVRRASSTSMVFLGRSFMVHLSRITDDVFHPAMNAIKLLKLFNAYRHCVSRQCVRNCGDCSTRSSSSAAGHPNRRT
jgi:hypothetical protein